MWGFIFARRQQDSPSCHSARARYPQPRITSWRETGGRGSCYFFGYPTDCAKMISLLRLQLQGLGEGGLVDARPHHRTEPLGRAVQVNVLRDESHIGGGCTSQRPKKPHRQSSKDREHKLGLQPQRQLRTTTLHSLFEYSCLRF